MGHLDSLPASQSVRPCVHPSVSQSVPQFVVLPSVCQSVLRPPSIRPSINTVNKNRSALLFNECVGQSRQSVSSHLGLLVSQSVSQSFHVPVRPSFSPLVRPSYLQSVSPSVHPSLYQPCQWNRSVLLFNECVDQSSQSVNSNLGCQTVSQSVHAPVRSSVSQSVSTPVHQSRQLNRSVIYYLTRTSISPVSLLIAI